MEKSKVTLSSITLIFQSWKPVSEKYFLGIYIHAINLWEKESKEMNWGVTALLPKGEGKQGLVCVRRPVARRSDDRGPSFILKGEFTIACS